MKKILKEINSNDGDAYVTVSVLKEVLKDNNREIKKDMKIVVETAINELALSIQKNFDDVSERFVNVEERLDGIDGRLDGIDRRLDYFAENYVKKSKKTLA